MYQLVRALVGHAKRWNDVMGNVTRPHLFRLSLWCTCSWLPKNSLVLGSLPAVISLALALLSSVCLWTYLRVSGSTDAAMLPRAFVDICMVAFFVVYIPSAVALVCILHCVWSMRRYRLDCRRRLFALGFDVETGDPVGDRLDKVCRLLAHSEPLNDTENPVGSEGAPFEPSNTEWYQSLTDRVRWSGTFAQDHAISPYIMRITQIERVGGNGTELVRFRGTGADSVNPFMCSGYACRRGGRVRLAWMHAYYRLGEGGHYYIIGDGTDGSSCEQRGVLTLDEHNNVTLTGRWAIEFIRPSYAPSGSLLSGTLALTAHYQ